MKKKSREKTVSQKFKVEVDTRSPNTRERKGRRRNIHLGGKGKKLKIEKIAKLFIREVNVWEI